MDTSQLYEMIGRLSFENAILRGEISKLQAQVKELTPQPESK